MPDHARSKLGLGGGVSREGLAAADDTIWQLW